MAQLGYTDQEISPRVQLNLDFARANMKSNIYDQAILEGVATSFPQTEDIIDNGIVNGISATGNPDDPCTPGNLFSTGM